MVIPATRIEVSGDTVDEITAYQAIKLLLDGAVERVDRAITCLNEGEMDETARIIQKTIVIVSRLRESLNMEVGGDLAMNLDMLYEYIIVRLGSINDEPESITALSEVSKLLGEVHVGWSGIAAEV